MEKPMTVEEVSKFLDVPVATIRKWCSKRYIPYMKIGRHVRFSRRSLEEWLKRKEIKRVEAHRLI